jgi:hypothetical protein
LKKVIIKYLLIFFTFFNVSAAIAQNDSFSLPIDLGNNNNFKGFEFLITALKNQNLVFSGCVDGYPVFNQKFQLKCIKFLNQREHFRNLMLETGPSKALLINAYILSKDTSVEKILQSVSTTTSMKLYYNLKKLNQSLPDSLKIKVHGVDIEKNSNLPIIQIAQTLPDDSIPDNLRIAVESVKGMAKYMVSKGLENYVQDGGTDDNYYYYPGSFSITLSLNEFLKDYDSLKSEFKQWLGSKFPQTEENIARIIEAKEWKKYEYSAFQFALREETLYKNINNLLLKNPNEKFYGQFELCRVSNAILTRGCDFFNFSGIANRFTAENNSANRHPLCIGIFYSQEVEKITEDAVINEYRDPLHAAWYGRLQHWFDSISKNNAVFFNPENTKTPESTISKNYQILLLNNAYNAAAKYNDTVDSDSNWLKKKDAKSWFNRYSNARIYLGFEWVQPIVNLGTVNAVLMANGIDGIGNISSAGGALSVASANKSEYKFFYGESTNGGNYKNYRTQFSIGYNFIYSQFLKVAILPGLGYVRHILTLPSGNKPNASFAEFQAPKILINPSLYGSLAVNAYLEWAPFYLYAEGGRMEDFGNSRWKYNGEYTGLKGKLSNTAWYYSVGFGMALKMDWLGI